MMATAGGLWLTSPEVESEKDMRDLIMGLCLMAIVLLIAFIAILVAAIIGLVRVSRAANYLGGEIAEKTKMAVIIIIVGAVLTVIPIISMASGIVLAVGFFMLIWPLMGDAYRPWAIVFLVGSFIISLSGVIFFFGPSDIQSTTDFTFFLQGTMLTSLLTAIIKGLYAVLVGIAGEQMDALVAQKGPAAPAPPPPYGVPPMYGGGPPPPYPPPG